MDKQSQHVEKETQPGSGAYINLAVRLFLTDLGETSLGQESRIEHVDTAGGVKKPTVTGDRLLAVTLKKFIITSRINQIEVSRAELVSKKHEISDLTKLIVYALLYRLFPSNLLEALDAGGFTPGREDAAIDRIWMEKNRHVRHEIRLELFNLARPAILDERKSAERDPVYRHKSAAAVVVTLLEMIPARVYRLLAETVTGREKIVALIGRLVGEYLQRSRISDFLSAAFLEWVQNAEKINLKHAFTIYCEEYEKKHGKPFPVATVDRILHEDRSYREILTKLAEKNHIKLRINWKFGRSKHGKRGDPAMLADLAVVRIRLVNKGLIGEWVRRNIESKINASVKDKGLHEFDQPPEDELQLGSGLGLIFTSYLKNECQRQNIDIFVQTREDHKRGETVMTLTMRINPL